MEVGSRNNQVYDQLKQCIVSDFCFPTHFNDFDGVSYRI